jgi:NAD(P)-dependent dehydrogenase (short-subunit alcohol dehydrogenase family)
MSRTALVVGAAGGMGAEIAKALERSGYRVVATVLNDQEAAHLKAEAPKIKEVHRLDLSNADSVLASLEALDLPSLDAVVVAAAIGPTGPLEHVPLSTLRKTLEINTISAAAIYQACMPALSAARGRLILISSFSGKVGLPFLGHYTTSKFALEGLGDVMRREAKPQGVDVILIEPGGVKTGMVAGQLEDIARVRAALSASDAKRFGPMYDTFLGLMKRSLDGMLHPSAVADVVLGALQAPAPQARYQVGEDAKFMCDTARKSDVEVDAIVAGFLGGG